LFLVSVSIGHGKINTIVCYNQVKFDAIDAPS